MTSGGGLRVPLLWRGLGVPGQASSSRLVRQWHWWACFTCLLFQCVQAVGVGVSGVFDHEFNSVRGDVGDPEVVVTEVLVFDLRESGRDGR